MRPDTGVMRFGDDWPGVFIRGDAAAAYRAMVERSIDAMRQQPLSAMTCVILRQLAMLLESCDVGSPLYAKEPYPVQQVKPWEEAKA